ncbi:MAG: hypothetical protein M1G31_31310 [Pseudanabaena sp. Salubria-1]|jgi:hypothetical protein|nr:hypothetical protein [Pseudanabaena sp. Salubria-1]
MRLFLSNGFVVMIAIASACTNSLDAIAINANNYVPAHNDLSQSSLSHPTNISIISQNNPRLPRPKGSR